MHHSHRAILAVLSITPLTVGCSTSLLPRKTLQRDGGFRITVEASCPTENPGCDLGRSMKGTIDAVTRRMDNLLGAQDAVARQQGTNRIEIELPGLTDDRQALDLLRQRGRLIILDTGENSLPVGSDVTGQTCASNCQPGQYPIVFTGVQMDPRTVSAGTDPQTGMPIVIFEFAAAAQTRFAVYTRTHIGMYLTIALDERVIDSALINSQIDGPGEINGLPSMQAAQNLAITLKAGVLPLHLQVVGEEHVAPATPGR